MRLFDFSLKDNSLWDNRRGFWNNIGNLGTNVAGGVAGFIGTGFNPLGAAAGWSGANKLYDWSEAKITGSYEDNAWVDIGTIAAGGTAFSANAIGLTGGTTFGLVGGGAAGAASGGAATGGGGAGAAGGAASGGAGGAGIGSFLQSQGAGLAVDLAQSAVGGIASNAMSEAIKKAEDAERELYYQRNKAAAEAVFDASVNSAALKFLQNDLSTRQQAFDFEMAGRLTEGQVVASAGASNLAGASVRETFSELSSKTSKGARRYQTARKNAADAYQQDLINLQVARDNQINSVIRPGEIDEATAAITQAAPFIKFGLEASAAVANRAGLAAIDQAEDS